jgi:PTS system glucose-specific IIA component
MKACVKNYVRRFLAMEFKKLYINSPVNGKSLNIASVPDAVFSSKILGDGIAFEPDDGIIYSPVDGHVASLFPTKHGIGILSNEGIEILIHIGVDTLHLKGKGFNYLVHENQQVKIGDKLMEFDLEFIKQNTKSHLISMIVTNMDAVKSVTPIYRIVSPSNTALEIEVSMFR